MSEVRIRHKGLLKKVVSPEVAAQVVESGTNIASAGAPFWAYPKVFFRALAERLKQGEVKDLTLWAASPFNYDIDGVMAETGVMVRRFGSHMDNILRRAINSGRIHCNDTRPEMFPQLARSGALGKLSVAVVDAIAITEEGHIVPSSCPVDISSFVDMADKVIVEINYNQPAALEGVHDMYVLKNPPYQKEIPIYSAGDRIGTPYIPVGEDRITYIVESHESEFFPPHQEITPLSQMMAEHLINFFKKEVEKGHLPANLLPIEIGIGNIPDAIMKGLAQSDFTGLEVYSAVLGDGMMDLIESGKCKVVSGTGIAFFDKNWDKFCANIEEYKKKLVLRPAEITNHPEIVRRLGVISINGIIEADIYGHANSSHIAGTQLVNGVGGSGVFAQNGYLSIFITPSTGRGGKISSIVPMVTHADHSEHTVDVLVTEQGVADLRGLSPVERAREIISKCVHPDFKPLLTDYLERAISTVGGHEPQILSEAFAFHTRLKETGSMLASN